MQFTKLFAFVAFLFTISVLASPIAEPAASNALVSRAIGLDSILITCREEVRSCSNNWKGKCKDKCSHDHVRGYCNEIAIICRKAIKSCKDNLPHGYKWTGLPSVIVAIVCDILFLINDCLLFLLGKCGLLGLLTAVLALVIGLVSVVIIALNELLDCLCLYVDGLLSLVGALLYKLLGTLTCILCLCGLKI